MANMVKVTKRIGIIKLDAAIDRVYYHKVFLI
mgnify:CR=1